MGKQGEFIGHCVRERSHVGHQRR